MRDKMGPFLPEIYAFPYYGADMDDEVVEAECMKDIERSCASYLSAKEIAAVIIEPLQGDGGVLPAHPIFMRKLYDWCRENGILFISEEVQQGFWRTGKFFGIEHYEGIVPDGIIMGKSIGAGTPLGAFMARKEIMDCLPAPAHLFTLGGNPLSCAAGIAAFDYYQTDEFQELLAGNIELIEKLAADLKAAHPDIIEFCRNMGMSMGIGISSGYGATAEDVTYKILYRSYQRGLIVISLAGKVLRIQPPLNIRPEELTRGFEIIAESIEDFKKGDIPDSVFEFRAGW
jgi:4-aminobutyrate aminotransferase